MVLVENLTTGELVKFDLETDGTEFNNFLRKAVLDFIADVGNCTVAIGKNQYLTYDADCSEEPILWLVAAILYMECRESGEWGDIATITILNEEED